MIIHPNWSMMRTSRVDGGLQNLCWNICKTDSTVFGTSFKATATCPSVIMVFIEVRVDSLEHTRKETLDLQSNVQKKETLIYTVTNRIECYTYHSSPLCTICWREKLRKPEHTLDQLPILPQAPYNEKDEIIFIFSNKPSCNLQWIVFLDFLWRTSVHALTCTHSQLLRLLSFQILQPFWILGLLFVTNQDKTV